MQLLRLLEQGSTKQRDRPPNQKNHAYSKTKLYLHDHRKIYTQCPFGKPAWQALVTEGVVGHATAVAPRTDHAAARRVGHAAALRIERRKRSRSRSTRTTGTGRAVVVDRAARAGVAVGHAVSRAADRAAAAAAEVRARTHASLTVSSVTWVAWKNCGSSAKTMLHSCVRCSRKTPHTARAQAGAGAQTRARTTSRGTAGILESSRLWARQQRQQRLDQWHLLESPATPHTIDTPSRPRLRQRTRDGARVCLGLSV